RTIAVTTAVSDSSSLYQYEGTTASPQRNHRRTSYRSQTRSPLSLSTAISRRRREGPLPASASNSDGEPMPPSATGATRTLSSSIRPAARNDPLILPPPSSSSFRIPNSFLSFTSIFFKSMLVLPPNRYEMHLDCRIDR